jgi:RNA methyltransferase, TrmH family
MCRKASGFKSRVPHFSSMLTSLQNPLVKQFRRLHAAKYRRQEQCFLLEGTHLLQEAVLASWPLAVVCYTESWLAREPDLLARIQAVAIRCEQVSEDVSTAIATTVHPDGVVAIAHSSASAPVSIQRLGLVLDTLQDPGNVGTILRTAAAAGVEGVLLNAGSVDLESPKVLRASAGAWFRVKTALCDDLLSTVESYRQQGFQIVATSSKAELDYWAVDYTQPTLLMVGNEGAGLSEGLIQAANLQVRIPMSAGVESLNAAIATAVMLYEAKRQRAQHGHRGNKQTNK